MRKTVLSKTATTKLENLLDYLEKDWSSIVKANFIKKLDKSLEQINKYPLSFEKSKIKPNLHRCVVTKQTSLLYKHDEQNIYIITIFDTRMNPKKIKNQ